MCSTPHISVVIPTSNRLNNLISAVDSVKNQSFKSWELIISDDEKPSGETWLWLQKEAEKDSRIRPVQNPDRPGQETNTNHGMRQAVGKYIKILHDDDLLLPHCLEEFSNAVDMYPDIEVVSCRIREIENSVTVKDYRDLRRPKYVLLTPKQAGKLMYLQRDVGSGLPTALLIKKSVIANGGQMPEKPHLPYCIDSVWNMHLLLFGNRLVINKVFAEHSFRDGTKSLTSEITENDFEQEVLRLRQYQYEILSLLHCKVPSLAVIKEQLQIIWAFRKIQHCNFADGLKILLKCWHPYSWLLFFRYFLDSFLTTKRIKTPREKKKG
jgi:glycosyltransferase involved in cell wall biosynthesis